MSNVLYYKGIQLPQLRSFCVAATQANFTAAAKVLGLSPPAVWQQVRALERALDTPLLRRNGRAIELTPEGRLLLELVQPHISGLDSLVHLFKMRRAELPRQLTVAATNYFVSYHLPSALLAFTRAFPSIRVGVRTATWAEVLQLVEQGVAEVGVAPYDHNVPRNPRLDYEHVTDMQLMVLTTEDHPLAKKRKVVPEDLVKYPMIVQPYGTHGRAALETILERRQIFDQLHIIMELVSLDVVRKYVALGVGIAVIFVVAKNLEPLPGLQLRVLEADIERLPAAMVVRRGAHHSEPLEILRQEVRKALGSPR